MAEKTENPAAKAGTRHFLISVQSGLVAALLIGSLEIVDFYLIRHGTQAEFKTLFLLATAGIGVMAVGAIVTASIGGAGAIIVNSIFLPKGEHDNSSDNSSEKPTRFDLLYLVTSISVVPISTAFYLASFPFFASRYDLPHEVALLTSGSAGFGLATAIFLFRKIRNPTSATRSKWSGLLALQALPVLYLAATRWLPLVSWKAVPIVAVIFLLTFQHCFVVFICGGTRKRLRLSHPKMIARNSLFFLIVLFGGYGLVQLQHSLGTSSMLHRSTYMPGECLRVIKELYDLDGDGSSAILGGGDCNDLDRFIGPSAIEIVDNGIDDNCAGGDLSISDASLSPPKSTDVPASEVPTGGVDDQPRVIVVLTIDAMRADRFGAAGGVDGLTPNLDKFAENALLFRNAYAQGAGTVDSVPSIWASRYPIHFQYRGHQFQPVPNLPQVLREQGWRTFAIYGFPEMSHIFKATFPGVRMINKGGRFASKEQASEMTDGAIAWLETNGVKDNAPCLLWLHYSEPHLPHIPHEGFEHLGDSKIGLYNQEIAFVDKNMGRLLEYIENGPLRKRTITVISADHGEELGEHGYYAHALNLYETVLHVPLLIKAPGYTKQIIDERVRLIDVVPTLTSLAKINDPVRRDGRSLIPLMNGLSLPPAPVFAQSSQMGLDRRTVLLGKWKLTYNAHTGSFGLFDLESPDGEYKNLVLSRPDIVDRLADTLAKWWDRQFNDQALLKRLEFQSVNSNHPDYLMNLYDALDQSKLGK